MVEHVTDTKTGIVWGLHRFTENGDPVLHHTVFAVSSGDPYNIRSEQVVPREVFTERFVSGRKHEQFAQEETPDPGYLPGERP